jgi:hypothetical protein
MFVFKLLILLSNITLILSKIRSQKVKLFDEFNKENESIFTYDDEFDIVNSITIGNVCNNFCKNFLHTIYSCHEKDGFCSQFAASHGIVYNVNEYINSIIPKSQRNELTVIFDKHNSDKQTLHHNYGYYYNRYLKPFREVDAMNYLELGVYKGESLLSFRDYFWNAKNIVGIDIDDRCTKYGDLYNNIFVEIGSQTDQKFLTDVNNKYGSFDVILDDCSHDLQNTIESFEILFPLLNNKGIYIIEDTIVFRNNLDYFYNLTQFTQKDGYDFNISSGAVNPWLFPHQTSNAIEYSIGDIIFSNSLIIIYKDIKYHWIAEV